MEEQLMVLLANCMALGNFDIFNAFGPLYQQHARFALVRYGGGVIQMSGSIAGDTFARNRYGNYVRARTKPVNPNSTHQIKVRAIVSSLVERWNDALSDAQRAAWGLYASNVAWKNKLGEVVHLSGFNHYIRGNSWFLRLDRPPVDDGPTTFVLPATDPTMTCTSSEGTQLVTLNFDDTMDWCTEDDAFLWILEGQPIIATRNFFGGPYRGRSAKGGADPGGIASPQTYAAIHVISEGQRVWNQFRIGRADGRLSTPFYTNHVVAA